MNEIVLNNEVKSLIFTCGRILRPQVAISKNFLIVTKSISKQLKLDIHKYNSQYKNLKVTISSKYHDNLYRLFAKFRFKAQTVGRICP